MNEIFISYKRQNKEFVFPIVDEIKQKTGTDCWIDIDGIESDAQFAQVIINAINRCEIFLFMYSSAHSRITDYKNDWTIRELDFAQYKKKRVVFVNIDASPLSDWFYMLFGTVQQVDATNKESLEKLIQDINGWLGNRIQPTITRTPPCQSQIPIRHKIFRVGEEVIRMVRIPKGQFVMGELADTTGLCMSDYGFPHEVQITRDYYICEIPVTQRLWFYIMNEQPSRFCHNDKALVDSVSWDECMKFISKLNYALGVEFRLPTEAEWEYAARGGLSINYIYSGGDDLGKVAWYKGNSDGRTHEVALKAPNELGIFDMSGNVWEWCSDFYSDMDGNGVKDPHGPSFGKQHVYRGGCWCESDDCCVIARRSGLHDFKSWGGLGLRLAMSV